MTEPLLTRTAALIKVGGRAVSELTRDMIDLEVRETSAGLKTMRMRLVAEGIDLAGHGTRMLYLDGEPFDFGTDVEVILGSEAEPCIVFQGRVSAICAAFENGREPMVEVLAEDRLMDLRMTRRMRTYEKASDGDIARAIARRHGLAASIDAPGPTYEVVQQWNMSDLAFLRERARLLQADVWIDPQDTLCFQTRTARTGTELVLVQGNHLLALEARADLAHQRTAVRVRGFDARRRQAIDEGASADVVRAEIGSAGRTGPEILAHAFGRHTAFRVREVPYNDEEAAAWARAEILRRARAFVQVTGVTRGSPGMVVGSRVELQRVGRPFAGPGYYVTQICHTYDLEQGFRTAFDAERATLEGGSNA